jgi:diguanylate cyclase (GGDEF)-like protein
LQHIAVLMRRTFRSNDRLARLGGEEFISSARTDLELGKQWAQRLLESIERNPTQSPTGEYYFMTASFGVVALDSRTSLPVDALLKKPTTHVPSQGTGKNTIVAECENHREEQG